MLNLIANAFTILCLLFLLILKFNIFGALAFILFVFCLIGKAWGRAVIAFIMFLMFILL